MPDDAHSHARCFSQREKGETLRREQAGKPLRYFALDGNRLWERPADAYALARLGRLCTRNASDFSLSWMSAEVRSPESVPKMLVLIPLQISLLAALKHLRHFLESQR